MSEYRSLDRKGRNRIRAMLRTRDGDNCHWCKDPMEFGMQGRHRRHMATIDHIAERKNGGGDDHDNLVLAHRICNQLRDNGRPFVDDVCPCSRDARKERGGS